MREAIELVPGLWRWTQRHPDWHPGDFGAEVGSYAVAAGDQLLLIDPLIGADAQELGDETGTSDEVQAAARTRASADWAGGGAIEAEALIERLSEGRTVHVLITVGYHVRSAEGLCSKYGASLHGPTTAASRLDHPSLLQVWEPGVAGPGGAVPFAFGSPKRSERPLWLPSHRAVVFGDMVVRNPEGDLALWESRVHRSDERLAFYREHMIPTFAPLLERSIDHVLTTHGEPVIGDGAAALRAALAAEPWFFMD